MLGLNAFWSRFVPRTLPPPATVVPPLRKAPEATKSAPVKTVVPDTHPVYVEVVRPSGRGHHVMGVELALDVDILNAIYQAALDATKGEQGPIQTIVVRIAVPQAQEVTLLSAPPDPTRRPEDDGQLALFDLSSDEEDEADSGDDSDHECQFDEDGVCWMCGASEDDEDEEVDPVEYLAERLKESGRGSQKPTQRAKLAEAIFDHFLAIFDWQSDDLGGMWEQFDAVYGHLYDRLITSSFDPQDMATRLELIEDMLHRAEIGGIDPDDSDDVWRHFITHYQVSFSLVGGKRRPNVYPLKVKVAS